MEQKKTLWIVLAAGVFLLFVIGAALVLYAPEAKKSDKASYITSQENIYEDLSEKSPSALTELPDSLYKEEVLLNEENPLLTENALTEASLTEENTLESKNTPLNSLESLTAENLTVYANGTTNIYSTSNLEEEKVKAGNEAARRIIKETGRLRTVPEKTILPPENNTVSTDAEFGIVSYTKDYADKKAKSSVKESSSVPAAKTASSKVSSSSTSSASSAKAKTSSKTEVKNTVKEKEADRFWIQVASYSSKKKADEVRNILYDKGMQCEVFTWRNKDDTLLFRVRTGPYTTKSEAEYWKSAILNIEDFKKSGAYITNSSSGK